MGPRTQEVVVVVGEVTCALVHVKTNSVTSHLSLQNASANMRIWIDTTEHTESIPILEMLVAGDSLRFFIFFLFFTRVAFALYDLIIIVM